MDSEASYIYLPATTSTNSYINDLLADTPDLPEFTFVHAGFQSGGRGQHGSMWESLQGQNLLFSLLLRPIKLPANKSFAISKMVSVSIVDVLSRYASGFNIKWPNDIYWMDKKICGILIENTIIGDCVVSSVIGAGININQQEFGTSVPNPVSLRSIIGYETEPEDLLHEVAVEIISSYKSYIAGHYDTLDDEYFSLLYRREGFHRYESGGRQFTAEIRDVTPDGFLVLCEEDGTTSRYAFKEVAFLL